MSSAVRFSIYFTCMFSLFFVGIFGLMGIGNLTLTHTLWAALLFPPWIFGCAFAGTKLLEWSVP